MLGINETFVTDYRHHHRSAQIATDVAIADAGAITSAIEIRAAYCKPASTRLLLGPARQPGPLFDLATGSRLKKVSTERLLSSVVP
jgi:hypothetical protein